MTVTDVRKDPETRTLRITAEFAAAVERVWQVWEDPRQLEQWWGPPTWPATFVEHDLTPGGNVTYYMTGPDGEQARGWWRVLAADAPRRLEFEDGFADESGAPDPAMPVMIMRVDLEDDGAGGTRMSVETTFASTQDMDRILSMGMEEGLTQAMGQIDELVGSGVTPA